MYIKVWCNTNFYLHILKLLLLFHFSPYRVVNIKKKISWQAKELLVLFSCAKEKIREIIFFNKFCITWEERAKEKRQKMETKKMRKMTKTVETVREREREREQ